MSPRREPPRLHISSQLCSGASWLSDAACPLLAVRATRSSTSTCGLSCASRYGPLTPQASEALALWHSAATLGVSMSPAVNRCPRKKVAVVGGGCAGLAALWALSRTHHDVYLYEAADRLGGHSNTVEWRRGRFTTKVDAGFIVLNTVTYRRSPSTLDPRPTHYSLSLTVCQQTLSAS